MDDDEIDPAMQTLLDQAALFPDMAHRAQLYMLRGAMLGSAETVHHFLHGKKKGPTFRDCADASCRLVAALDRAVTNTFEVSA